MAKRRPPAGPDTRDGAAGDGDQTSTTAAGFDPDDVIRAIAQDRAREARARRYQDIPAEGVAIERRDLDALAVHLDLDAGTVIAARQYPDQLVYVTSDGRKVAGDMR